MRFLIKKFLLSLILLVTSNCSQSQPAQVSKPDIESTHSQLINQVYQELELDFTHLPTSTTTRIPPTETTVQKVSQITPTITTEQTTPTIILKDTEIVCDNNAEVIKILNLANYTQLKTGEPFAKIWRIKNTGTCTWTINYQLFFADGSQMSSPNEIALHHEVLPGESIDLRVNGYAPLVPDQYFSEWFFRDELGNIFGIGDTAEEPLDIIIIVNKYTEKYDPDPGPT